MPYYYGESKLLYVRDNVRLDVFSSGSEETVPGAGSHRFYFDGKSPLAFRVLAILLCANTTLGLGLDFVGQYFLPKASANLPPCESLTRAGVQYHAPALVCWFAGRFIAIQFILLALIGAVLIIFRNRVRHIPSHSRPSKPVMIALLVVMISVVTLVMLSQLGWLG